MSLSERQYQALLHFAGGPETNPFAAGTISSLRKLGLVEREVRDVAGHQVTYYALTAAGCEAIGLRLCAAPGCYVGVDSSGAPHCATHRARRDFKPTRSGHCDACYHPDGEQGDVPLEVRADEDIYLCEDCSGRTS